MLTFLSAKLAETVRLFPLLVYLQYPRALCRISEPEARRFRGLRGPLLRVLLCLTGVRTVLCSVNVLWCPSGDYSSWLSRIFIRYIFYFWLRHFHAWHADRQHFQKRPSIGSGCQIVTLDESRMNGERYSDSWKFMLHVPWPQIVLLRCRTMTGLWNKPALVG